MQLAERSCLNYRKKFWYQKSGNFVTFAIVFEVISGCRGSGAAPWHQLRRPAPAIQPRQAQRRPPGTRSTQARAARAMRAAMAATSTSTPRPQRLHLVRQAWAAQPKTPGCGGQRRQGEPLSRPSPNACARAQKGGGPGGAPARAGRRRCGQVHRLGRAGGGAARFSAIIRRWPVNLSVNLSKNLQTSA